MLAAVMRMPCFVLGYAVHLQVTEPLVNAEARSGEHNRPLFSSARGVQRAPIEELHTWYPVEKPSRAVSMCASLLAIMQTPKARLGGTYAKQLRLLENVTLLPHIGSATEEVRAAMGMIVADNLDAFFAKQPLPNKVI